MQKKNIVIVVLCAFLLIFGIYKIAQIVTITGPVVWVDRSRVGSWKVNKNSASWLKELSQKNPNMKNVPKWVIVWLMPNLQTSPTSAWQKNHSPFIYSNLTSITKNINVITISVDWDEWNQIKVEDRGRVTEFVLSRLGDYWRVPVRDSAKMIEPVVDSANYQPVEIVSDSR